jgi:membrane-associated phospholipid phosphatase/tRNA A-37 threonylcarbamoyl transferase component Bud32
MSTTEPRGDVTSAPEAKPRRRARKRRRPSGAPPPLPHHIGTSGRVLLAGLGGVVLLLVLLIFEPIARSIEQFDDAILQVFVELRTEALTKAVRAIDALGSEWTIGLLRWGTILALLIFKRFRHLLVLIGSILAVGWFTSIVAQFVVRYRPRGIEILTDWQGASFPSRPVAVLAVSLLGIAYTLVVPGRPRAIAKIISSALIAMLGLAEVYLGTHHPMDVIIGAIIGAAIPVVAFRLFTPNEVFPVAYKKGRAAHLDVGGARGVAIRSALEDQLGLTILEMKPFGLAGSGGSTPLLLRVEGAAQEYLFAKLYAATHLRADRWYKLGRTLLYGRLEDEGSFSDVRRLIQYEDYMLRVMRDAAMPTPVSYGFIEITPGREYLLVTEFLQGGSEILDVEVDDSIIDSGLEAVKALWDNGLAHRDIKPSNILVRDGKVHLIDVAFGQVRPSPWRQAVDLANMMLVLALQTDADRVYERALAFFTPEEIAEAFAATRSVTMPSQSRSMLKKARTDLVGRFRELAPPRAPISIQRWSFRRVALSVGVFLTVFLTIGLALSNLQGAGLLADPEAERVALPFAPPECARIDDSWGDFLLEIQSVPTSSKVLCVAALPLGWEFRGLDSSSGGSEIVLDSDRAGVAAASATLTESCDTSGATEVPTDEPGTRRFEKIDTFGDRYTGSRYYTFEGGCATYTFDFSGPGRTSLAEEVTAALSFLEKSDFAQKYEEITDEELPY